MKCLQILLRYLVFAALVGGGAPVNALVLDPFGGASALTEDEIGHINHGIRIHVLHDISLDSFVYNGQGQSDTVQLRLSGAGNPILQSAGIAAGPTSTLVIAGWTLLGGLDYDLFGTTTSNGKFCEFTCAPNGNADISVSKGFFSNNNFSGYWADFSAITTSNIAAVPEPETYALLLAGLGLLGFTARRRKRVEAA